MLLRGHPLFAPFNLPYPVERTPLGRASWSRVASDGTVWCDTRMADVDEWVGVLAHQLCHLGMGHLTVGRRITRDGQIDPRWNAACCVEVDRFLSHLKVGRCPVPIADLPDGDLDSVRRCAATRATPDADPSLYGVSDRATSVLARREPEDHLDFEALFAGGLRAAVSAAVEVAGGGRDSLTGTSGSKSSWRRGWLDWFVSSYPLLGGIAAGIELVADADRPRPRHLPSPRSTPRAARSTSTRCAPHATTRSGSCSPTRCCTPRCATATACGAATRTCGTSPATTSSTAGCVEMGVGDMPDGCCYDPALTGCSAEEVYDRIATDLRRMRKLATLRGTGLGDILGGPLGGTRATASTSTSSTAAASPRASTCHQRQQPRPAARRPGRGDPGARATRRCPWDAAAGPLVRRVRPRPEPRTHLRPPRRAARRPRPTSRAPAATFPPEEIARCTFGVVLDTSGSMDRTLLGKALGAIASYADGPRRARGARRLLRRGRRTTPATCRPRRSPAGCGYAAAAAPSCSPASTCCERADDFPPSGPVLVITDGECDVLRVRREHAFLIPHGAASRSPPRAPSSACADTTAPGIDTGRRRQGGSSWSSWSAIHTASSVRERRPSFL